MTRHTFLLQEGEWDATGAYWTDQGAEFSVEGHTSITHGRMHWVNNGYMRLLLTEPVEFQNRYQIQPFADGSDWTTWTSHNPTLGVLRGTFMVVDDCILSSYTSEDGRHSGMETMLLIDPCTYRCWGFTFSAGRKLSSWAVVLRRGASHDADG